MPAAIYWEPADASKARISCPAPSSFIDRMTKVFHGFPLTLSESDIPALKAMAVMYESKPNPYEELLDILEQHRSIRLWASY